MGAHGAPRRMGRPGGGSRRGRRRGRRVRVFLAARAAGHRRDRAACRSPRSGSVRGRGPCGLLDGTRMTSAPAASFTCLWCGTVHAPRAADDLEAWARLCPDCLGRADENEFLRFRLRQALDARGRAAAAGDLDAELVRYYEARTGEYDDWYLREGRYEHG